MSAASHGDERLLVIDCATPALSVALFEGANCLAYHNSEISRGHAEALLPVIAALPEGGRAARILVDVGPGSFTGVRVGVAAARALGFAWGVPVNGFCCLDLIAAMVRDRFAPSTSFSVVMVGGHGELFWANHAPTAEPATSHVRIQSTPIAELAAQLDSPEIFGSGAAILVGARGDRLSRPSHAVHMLPDARYVGSLSAPQKALEAIPIYGRDADAKPMDQSKVTLRAEQPHG